MAIAHLKEILAVLAKLTALDERQNPMVKQAVPEKQAAYLYHQQSRSEASSTAIYRYRGQAAVTYFRVVGNILWMLGGYKCQKRQ